MSDTQIEAPLHEFTGKSLERKFQYFDILLPLYEDSFREAVSLERDSLMDTAEELDRELGNLARRSRAAQTAKSLVPEMRQLRVRGLQVFLFLHTSRRLLNVVKHRLTAQARISGLDREGTILKIDLDMSEVDLIFRRADKLVGKPTPQFTRLDEIKLFLKAVFLPLTSRLRQSFFGESSRKYAAANARNDFFLDEGNIRSTGIEPGRGNLASRPASSYAVSSWICSPLRHPRYSRTQWNSLFGIQALGLLCCSGFTDDFALDFTPFL
jgi:hypothetical protein